MTVSIDSYLVGQIVMRTSDIYGYVIDQDLNRVNDDMLDMLHVSFRPVNDYVRIV